jgi:hypothetical protein
MVDLIDFDSDAYMPLDNLIVEMCSHLTTLRIELIGLINRVGGEEAREELVEAEATLWESLSLCPRSGSPSSPPDQSLGATSSMAEDNSRSK